MGKYTKGAGYERELLSIFLNKGFAVIRVAGSGRARIEQPDLLASNGKKIFGIECKYSSSNYKTIIKEEVNSLILFCKKFDCIPLLAFRFSNKKWKIIKLNHKYVNQNINVKKNNDYFTVEQII